MPSRYLFHEKEKKLHFPYLLVFLNWFLEELRLHHVFIQLNKWLIMRMIILITQRVK